MNWKLPLVVAIHSGGKLPPAGNYRPVSAIFTLNDSLEKLIRKHMCNGLMESGLVPRAQSYFLIYWQFIANLHGFLDEGKVAVLL